MKNDLDCPMMANTLEEVRVREAIWESERLAIILPINLMSGAGHVFNVDPYAYVGITVDMLEFICLSVIQCHGIAH